MELNKEDLGKHQAEENRLIGLKKELRAKQDLFDEENKDIIQDITGLSKGLGDEKEEIRTLVKQEYDKDHSQRKFIGGLSVKVGAKLLYEKEAALTWAKDKMPVAIKTVLDTKLFEKFAKENELDFVKKEEKVVVCFPGDGLKLEGGD